MPANPRPVPTPPSAPAGARMPRPLPRIVAVLALLHAYIGWRLLPALALGVPGWSVGVILLTLSTLLMPLSLFAGMLTHRRTLADRLSGIGALAMGLFSSLLVLTLLRDLALAVLPGWFGVAVSAAAVPLLALLVTLIGLVNARRIARVLDIDVAIDGLAPALDGFTIVQLSDIHVGATIKSAYVAAIVGRVNTLDADLVAITGDVVDGGVPQLRAHTAPLAGLRSRHGSFLVTGNHEYYSGADAWVAEFTRIGLRVLMNEHVVIEHDGAALVLAGVTDFSAGHHDPAHRSDPQRALVGAPAGLTRVLLAHQPRSAEAAEAAGFDLQLSGHTHGGQFWPWNLFVRLQQPYTAGLHRLRRLWVYTSRGTGYWGPPKRFGAPAEITRIRLRPA